MKLLIVGGGKTAEQLAHALLDRGGFELTLVEPDNERCESLAGEMDILAINGDGTRPDILKKAEIGKADAVICLTGSDAINVVITMLAKQHDVPCIIPRLHEPSLRAACELAGATEIILPKTAAVAAIIDALHGTHRLALTSGNLRFARFNITAHAGTPVGDLELPRGLLAVAVRRGERDMLLAEADLRLESGDELILVSDGDDATKRAAQHFGIDQDGQSGDADGDADADADAGKANADTAATAKD